MKIHKKSESIWKSFYFALCGSYVENYKTHYHWKKVTCQNCLKQKIKMVGKR